MKTIHALLAVAVGLVAPIRLPAAAADDLSNPKIVVLDKNGDHGYRPTQNAALQDTRNKMIARGPLAEYVRFMSPVRVHKTLGVVAQECGRVDIFYSSDTRSITVCYEFMKYLEDLAQRVVQFEARYPKSFPIELDRNAQLAGSFAGIILHESGHALFDILNVPMFGREEDAADQIAAFVALQFQRQVAETVVAAMAASLDLTGDNPTAAPNIQDPKYPHLPADQNSPEYRQAMDARCALDPMCAWSDEHGSGSQRFYNTACIVFGSDPQRYANWASAGWVPPNCDCVGEYKRIYAAFATTIYPFIDLKSMKEVQATQWFLPKEVKP